MARALSAAALVLGLVLGLAFAAYAVSEQASKLVGLLPQAAQKLNAMVRAAHGEGDSGLASVQKAAARLEQAAAESTQATSVSRGMQQVLETLGQAGMVSLITFFLLASGDRFRRKVVKLAGPGLHNKRITLQALNQIHDRIQRYMLVQLLTSLLVAWPPGCASWPVDWRMRQPGAWPPGCWT